MAGEIVDRGDELNFHELDDVGASTEVVETQAAVETPEAPETKVAPEHKERDDNGRFIPKGRFDEAVAKERGRAEAAERKFAELQASIKQVDINADSAKLETEIVELEKQHARLVIDGDHERAAYVMAQIRLKERSILIQQSTNLTASVKNEMREELRMDTAIESLETTYPILNPNDESYDQDMIDMVLGVQRTLIENERLSPSAALVKAAQKVMNKLAPKAQDTGVQAGLAAAKVSEDRKAAQVAKNIDTAKRQPPSMKDSGMDTDKAGINGPVDVSKLTRAEFAALPAATKAKLRGDML